MEKASSNVSSSLHSANPAQHQNISINISYNLNTNKIPKLTLGSKKVASKSKKVNGQGLQGIGNQFFNNLALNTIKQGKKVVKKQNIPKKSNQIGTPKQAKIPNDKKSVLKKKKNKQINHTQPAQQLLDGITQFYNPLANNSKDFLKRNIQSPDIFKVQNTRKLKTQASYYDATGSTFKKLKKTSLNAKQNSSNVVSKSSKLNNWMKQCNLISTKAPLLNPMMKKSSTTSKTPKNKKSISQLKQKKRIHTQQNEFPISQPVQSRHNKSCMLYSTKRQGLVTEPNLVEAAQNIISTYASVNSNKNTRKRAQSAYSFTRNDKQLVSKLLNMSTISSQLGSSQLISSQRIKSGRNGITRHKLGLKVDQLDQFNHFQNHNQTRKSQGQHQIISQLQEPLPGHALRQYLNSIDLRIIKNIQDDTANIIFQQPQNNIDNKAVQSQSKQTEFTKNNNRNLQTLRNNSQQNQNKDVVSFYSNLFSKALNDKKVQEELDIYLDSANYFSQKDNFIFDFATQSKLKKQKFLIKGFGDDPSEKQINKRNQIKQIQEKLKGEKPQKNSVKLNFKHYKQILDRKTGKQKDEIELSDLNSQTLPYEKDFQFFLKGQSFLSNQKPQSQDFDSESKQILDLLQLQDKQTKQNKIAVQQEDQVKNFTSEQNGNLDQYKQQLVQRQNNINKILSNKMRNENDTKNQNNQVVDQLVKQQMWNKKWIQQEQITHTYKNYSQAVFKVEQLLLTKDQKVQKPKQPLKSPKQNNRHKKAKPETIEPQYNEVCWQYTADKLEWQIEICARENQKPTPKNVFNSPNNYSQDGNGSGQEQYDSKKYTQQSIYKDQIVQPNQSQQNSTEKDNENPQKMKVQIDSLNQDEDQEISYQQKQVNFENRWINAQNLIFVNQTQNEEQGRIRKFKLKSQNPKRELQKQNNFLQCDLSSFGVRNKTEQHKEEADINAHLQSQFSQGTQTQRSDGLIQLNQVLMMINQEEHDIQGQYKKMVQGKQSQQKTLKSSQNKESFTEVRQKRLTHIVEDIILEMIKQFAKDISYILKKSSLQEKKFQKEIEDNTSPFRSYKQPAECQNELSPFYRADEHFQAIQSQNFKQQQAKKNQFVGKCFGIDTSFLSVQRYLKEFKGFLVKSQPIKQAMIKNINKDIGPNSLQILSYLRPQYEIVQNQPVSEQDSECKMGQQQNCDDQDGLFVVPSQAFSQFQNYLQQRIEEKNKNLQPQKQIVLTQKQKRNTNFWHRGIYQSWNQFLDYERPYGINGEPYEWVQQKKKFRQVRVGQIQTKLQKGIDKLLEAISLPSGIIYDKFDLPVMYSDLNQDQKIFLNEQRLSRMLAIQLFQSQETWINYNDEMAQLLVELSRIIEQRIFFQLSTELKKLVRKRGSTLITVRQPQSSDTDQIQKQQLTKQGNNQRPLLQIQISQNS